MARLTRRERIRVASIRRAEKVGTLSHGMAEQLLGPLAGRDRLTREHPLRDFAAAIVNAFALRPVITPGPWPRKFRVIGRTR